MGRERGRPVVIMDCITDALVPARQHGVYCQSARQLGKPAMDMQLISKSRKNAKELISRLLESKSGGLMRLFTGSEGRDSVPSRDQRWSFDRGPVSPRFRPEDLTDVS
jgi:hypothetical protein